MSLNILDIWNSILNIIEKELSPLAFATWLKPLKPISLYGGIFVLEASNSFTKEQAKKYSQLIENALTLETQMIFQVRFTTTEENNNLQNSPNNVAENFNNSSLQASENPLSNKDTTSYLTSHDNQAKPVNLNSGFNVNGFSNNISLDYYQKVIKDTTLPQRPSFNPRYTFDRFVVGDSNQFAHAACLSVAQNIGNNQNNPLFIYGGSGLGKTHLMHAIGNYLIQTQPTLYMIYVTCETFINEFISAIRRNSYESFRAKYRKCHILFIDDIQFIEGKDQIQIEFFNTFNSIYENGCNIVITSDKPPQSLEKLEERLRSRFSSGLIVDVKKPTYETRLAILDKLALSDQIQIDFQTIDFIANHITNNIRELEGAFKNVVAYASLGSKHNTISLEDAKEALKSAINPSLNDQPSSLFIIQLVCNYFNISQDELLSKNKKKNIAEARQIAMYLLVKYGNMTYEQIGKELGGKHHTTVLHGFEKISLEIKNNNPYITSSLNNLKKRLDGNFSIN